MNESAIAPGLSTNPGLVLRKRGAWTSRARRSPRGHSQLSERARSPNLSMPPNHPEHEMTDETTTPLQPPAPPPPRRLSRPRDDRLIAGVCSGLGRYFNVDPVLFRVGAVALIFFGGAGILLYLAAILLIPNEGEER